MATITTEIIPKHINKKQRARLINMQRQKIMRQLRDIRFVFECQTMKVVTPYNSKLEKIGMTKAFVEALNATPMNWRVNCYILARESNGKNKLIDFEVLIETPCRHGEIAEMIADALYAEVEDFRTKPYAKNFITAAWIAHHIDTETSIDDAYKIFESVGAWGLPSDAEEEIENNLK